MRAPLRVLAPASSVAMARPFPQPRLCSLASSPNPPDPAVSRRDGPMCGVAFTNAVLDVLQVRLRPHCFGSWHLRPARRARCTGSRRIWAQRTLSPRAAIWAPGRSGGGPEFRGISSPGRAHGSGRKEPARSFPQSYPSVRREAPPQCDDAQGPALPTTAGRAAKPLVGVVEVLRTDAMMPGRQREQRISRLSNGGWQSIPRRTPSAVPQAYLVFRGRHRRMVGAPGCMLERPRVVGDRSRLGCRAFVPKPQTQEEPRIASRSTST